METDTRAGSFPWPIVVIFVIAAALVRAPALIILAAGGVVAWLVVAVTERLALAALDVRARVEPDRLVAGEETVVTIELHNRKPLPLTWLDVRLYFPEGIEPSPALPGVARGWLDAGFAPRGRERVTLRLRLRVTARGA